MRAILCLMMVAAVLAGCAKRPQTKNPEVITQAAYKYPGPPALTLYTMVNNRTGDGAHTSLMIGASERVIFDPAGTFQADVVPQKDDVLYGITPGVEKAYRGAHARSAFHVVVQTVPVTAEQAEIAYQLALRSGPVASAFCASSTAKLLQNVPGFEGIKSTMSPINLMEQYGQIPGARTERYYENDAGDITDGVAAANAALNASAQQE